MSLCEYRFTKGKWELNERGEIIADGRVIAVVKGLNDRNPERKAENLVNARLIAAAPELYTRLDEVLHSESEWDHAAYSNEYNDFFASIDGRKGV